MGKKITQQWVQERLSAICDEELDCGYPELGDCPEECPINQVFVLHPDDREFEVKTVEEIEPQPYDALGDSGIHGVKM